MDELTLAEASRIFGGGDSLGSDPGTTQPPDGAIAAAATTSFISPALLGVMAAFSTGFIVGSFIDHYFFKSLWNRPAK